MKRDASKLRSNRSRNSAVALLSKDYGGKGGSMAGDIEALARREVRLEQENRLLKMIGLGSVLGLLVLMCMGAANRSRMIEAEKITLIDSQGRARVTIGTPWSSGAAIDTERDAPVIWLSDEKGNDRAMLSADGLFFANSRAKPVLSLSSDPRPGRSALRFYGPDGKVSWSAP